MATVHIVLSQVGGRSTGGAAMPVANSIPIEVDTMTSTTSSVKSSIVASKGGLASASAFWTITGSGGNVWLAFGSDPTAAADSGWLLLDGQTRDFAVTGAAETVAIKDA